MNGRKARLMRQAATVFATDGDAYAPQTVRNGKGAIVAVFPERRWLDGSPRSIARRMRRRRWHRPEIR